MPVIFNATYPVEMGYNFLQDSIPKNVNLLLKCVHEILSFNLKVKGTNNLCQHYT